MQKCAERNLSVGMCSNVRAPSCLDVGLLASSPWGNRQFLLKSYQRIVVGFSFFLRSSTFFFKLPLFPWGILFQFQPGFSPHSECVLGAVHLYTYPSFLCPFSGTRNLT